MDKKHLKITVTGVVQGVAFRFGAQKIAQNLELTGFARNQPDGSVYIEVEGTTANLEKFLQWCHRGPRQAVVNTVTSTLHEPLGHTGFAIF